MKKSPTLVLLDYQSALLPFIANYRHMLKRTRLMIECAILLDLPIIYTEQVPKKLGRTIPYLDKLLVKNSVYFEKNTFSAYKEPVFRNFLQENELQEIWLAGIETNICVQQTILDLLEAGHTVTLVSDCTSARSLAAHDESLALMRQGGIRTASLETLIFSLLEGAEHEVFKSFQALLKKYS